MNKLTKRAKNVPVFWGAYALGMLILSLGCVAGDSEKKIGQIGVCGASVVHSGRM